MGYERGQRLAIKTLVSRAHLECGELPRSPHSREKTSVGEVGMVKKVCGAIAFGVTVMLVLTLGELPSASAIHDRDQRVKTRKKENRRRRLVNYVCPMHPDIRSKSHGTCPKCLMDLVVEKRGAKAVRH